MVKDWGLRTRCHRTLTRQLVDGESGTSNPGTLVVVTPILKTTMRPERRWVVRAIPTKNSRTMGMTDVCHDMSTKRTACLHTGVRVSQKNYCIQIKELVNERRRCVM